MISSEQDAAKNVFPFFYGTAISRNISKRLHVRNLYLFSYPNIYFYGRAGQWQLSKFTHRNTVTTFRTLVKSYKGLKWTKKFACKQQKSWSEKFHKIQPRETVMKSFFRYVTANFSEKELHHSCFLMTFGSFFSIFVLLSTCEQPPLKEVKGHIC